MYICIYVVIIPPALYCQMAVGLGCVPLNGLTKFFLVIYISMHPFI